MLFFQLTLLAGYAYAHAVHQRLNVRRQAIVHIILLALATVLLPILPDQAWKPDGSEDPVFLILGLLAATVGLPYLMLSTTGPLVQAWYAREHRQGQQYRLFALSNAAALDSAKSRYCCPWRCSLAYQA